MIGSEMSMQIKKVWFYESQDFLRKYWKSSFIFLFEPKSMWDKSFHS